MYVKCTVWQTDYYRHDNFEQFRKGKNVLNMVRVESNLLL